MKNDIIFSFSKIYIARLLLIMIHKIKSQPENNNRLRLYLRIGLIYNYLTIIFLEAGP